MGTPIYTVNDIPVYATQTDLDTTGQEPGNLAVTADPATLWIWSDDDGWMPVTSTNTTALAARVTRIETRLACLRSCLADDDG